VVFDPSKKIAGIVAVVRFKSVYRLNMTVITHKKFTGIPLVHLSVNGAQRAENFRLNPYDFRIPNPGIDNWLNGVMRHYQNWEPAI
jgi:hypothetical protein